MKKILIISDNEILNTLYLINYEVYLAVDIIVVTSYEDAVLLLRSKVKFDIILTLEFVAKKHLPTLILDHLKAYGQKMPLIIVGNGEISEKGERIFPISGKFNIQDILKTSAKILEITAKQMASLDVGEYYPINTSTLLAFSKSPCQIYNLSNADYVAIIEANKPVGNVLNEMNENGVQQVFVKSKDRLNITNKISLTLIDKITENLNNLEGATVEKKVQALSDGFEFAASNLFSSDEIKQEMQEIASASARIMSEVASESVKMDALIAILKANKEGYIFTHSMITSYVSMHLLKNISWGGEGAAFKVNFILFFHDIYLAPIYLKHQDLRYESTLDVNTTLSLKEREIYINHPKLAADLVVAYRRCPIGADVLIKQHHGSKKGKASGKLYEEDISPLAKVILIAELFVEEFMKADEANVHFNLFLAILKINDKIQKRSYEDYSDFLKNISL